ncbi:MAG: 2-oxoacid:ferredoxin oxidoreductase subunit beta [Candidatus Tectomicrobia bacterium]|nr:2-oxoacid:ferredoxin oxidoreductase subunit beta [Candidatus Tectomicrobia bacterium]
MNESNGDKERGQTEVLSLTRKDFASDQEVRWCPGCGDYSILAQVQKVLPTFHLPREKYVFISGIGCSSRFPYYMKTYGFHTIHGRAPAVASGLKCVRPDLSVWVITGDGDALSIGGNHFIHLMRRNIDLNVLLFNNRIYGLTKGQYSPTSELGKKTKSTPMGSLEQPLNPVAVALAAGATFVARTIDTEIKHLQQMLERAQQHKGTSFVEIYQNCPVFNDGAWESLTDKATRSDHVLTLEHGKPLVFGKENEKGIRLHGLRPEVVALDAVAKDDLLSHDEKLDDTTLAYMLSRFDMPQLPVPIGVFRAVEKPTYENLMQRQIDVAIETQGEGDLEALLHEGDTWVVQ